MLKFQCLTHIGTSCAYCSIIGYIKARDFAVGNDRSQPSKEGRNEFYRPMKGKDSVQNTKRNETRNDRLYGQTYQESSLYQSDGNPQFLGTYIERPNQAAISAPNR